MDDLYNLFDNLPAKDDSFSLPRDTEMIELAQMLAVGKTTKEIALILDRSEHWVRQHRNDESVRLLTTSLQKEALESAKSAIVSGTARAAETLVNLLDAAPPPIRLAAAKDLLDRVGLKTPEKKQTDVNVQISAGSREERLKLIKERASRLGLELNLGDGSVRDQSVESD